MKKGAGIGNVTGPLLIVLVVTAFGFVAAGSVDRGIFVLLAALVVLLDRISDQLYDVWATLEGMHQERQGERERDYRGGGNPPSRPLP